MKKKKLHRKQRLLIKKLMFVLAIFVLIIFVTYKIERSVRPLARLQAKHFAEKTANEIIEKSVSEYLKNNRFTYSDFAAVLYDEKKRIASVETIPYTINKVQSDLTLLINKELDKTGKRSANIAVGSLTNSYMLTGKGPKIRIRVSPIGVADVRLKSDFIEAGINQTRHRISAVITVKMSSSVPLYSFETSSDFEFILAESILIGNVPDISAYPHIGS
ncbi:sporulation protein YunB [Ruminococcus flavefaciens]|uniref:sporulation protein YunB n=1 Tax=Ruminococcus flavefaciens TaxID=1265 RepID=UPI0026EFB44A|nr:sporulation protein YunB [Ruminococcus flavefaciens]MDD7515634.1 sporulation protein YunB [Ruminococcus flavefaciens]MDY5690329.1 sporulation protein YunB [Ruminococcus flavefaciens]